MIIEFCFESVEFLLNESWPKPLYKLARDKWVTDNETQWKECHSLLVGVWWVVDSFAGLPEDLDIVTPLDMQSQPPALNGNVVDAFNKAVSRQLLNI